jgi:pseudaminic acid synthase
MERTFWIGERGIGPDHPVFVLAELSGNHNGDLGRAERIIRAAKRAGADAVKLQTYTPDSMTLDSTLPSFQTDADSPWAGRSAYSLYEQAQTPWDWHPRLIEMARELGLLCFSSPFDSSAVDFLEDLEVPAYKVASPEIVDIPLLRKIAACKKPIILSTGMARHDEIAEAVTALRAGGAAHVALLHCVSAYPAKPEEMNLRSLPRLADDFDVPVGLSDHSMDMVAAVAAVALGACIIEKHLTLRRGDGGPDSGFSLEPEEFAAMVQAIRRCEQALGEPRFGPSAGEMASLKHRRSLFVVADMGAGATFSADNVRSIRPADGLHPRYLDQVLGRRATSAIRRGTALRWDLVEGLDKPDERGARSSS